ncbi:MAG: SPOR domain-containing protein [Treponema sp.]|jgi:DedD protein|nr:SPOR domain-containing protein [Treponema sp.]
MEKKKLLLIAASLGIFLVIVVGLSILIFAPKKRDAAASGTSTPEYAGFPNNPAPRDPPPPDNAPMVANVPTEPPPASSGSRPYSYDSEPKTPGAASGTVVEIVPPSKTAVPDTAPGGRAAQQPASAPAATVYRSSTPAPSAKGPSPDLPSKENPGFVPPPQQVSAAPAPRPALAPAPAPVVRQPVAAARPSPKTYSNYWVQAGAFSTQIRAEDVRENLKTKGLSSVIETSDVNGRNLFRVRVGPYTSQNEADYWLALIKTIDGFQDSLIWQN